MTRYNLPPLPYKYDALEPVIIKRIMELHHSIHHQGYVNGANAALEKLEKYAKGEMEIDVKAVMRDYSFHLNGHLLHSIFWPIMRPPEENNKPGGRIGDLIDKQFGSFEAFQKVFGTAAKKVEGVGWAVLYADAEDNLHIVQIEKHNLMHLPNMKILLVIDVWEHAYYLQYENKRGAYVDAWWQVVNWDEVERLLEKGHAAPP